MAKNQLNKYTHKREDSSEKGDIYNMNIFKRGAINHVGNDTECAQMSSCDRAVLRIKIWLKDVMPVVLAVYILFGIILNVRVIYGKSMCPTLEDGTLVFFQHIGYTPERGDVVILDIPNYDKELIKRIIAVEGDTIDINFNTGTVILNGEVLREEYVTEPTYLNGGTEFPLTVMRDHVFVMGDNRNDSTDSRFPMVGQVDVDNIIGGYIFSIRVKK